MKLCRVGPKGREIPALQSPDGRLHDLSGEIDDISASWLSAGGLEALAQADLSQLPEINRDTRRGVPVADIGKIVCAGMNYHDHCAEAGVEVPTQPAIFMKATSSLSGPDDPIVRPQGASQLDWEIELAAVIGVEARNVSRDEALDHVAGYTILNDVTDRDFQFNHGGQWLKGKSADTFCPLGPWLVTPDEIDDPQSLGMTLSVNGERMQAGSTSQMVFGLADLISHISRYMTLHPGDVVSTGTPPGVGMGQKPEPRWLEDGDIVTLEIDGLGRQEQRVAS